MSQHNLTPPPANISRISELCGLYTYHLTDLGNARRLIALFGDHLRYIPSHGWYTSTYPVHSVGSVHSATASNSVSAITPVSDSTFNHPVACVHPVEIPLANPKRKRCRRSTMVELVGTACSAPNAPTIKPEGARAILSSSPSGHLALLHYVERKGSPAVSVDPSIPNPSPNLTSNRGSAHALHLLQPKNNLETLPNVGPVHFFDLLPTSHKPNPTNPENCQASDYSTKLEVKMRKAF